MPLLKTIVLHLKQHSAKQKVEWGNEAGVFQNTKCLSRDLQHSHEAAFQKNDQEKNNIKYRIIVVLRF